MSDPVAVMSGTDEAAGRGSRLSALRSAWAGLPQRERRLLLLAAAVLAAFLVWTVGVQPAWRTVREAPARIDALDASLQAMQRLATEARELRATPPISVDQSSAALKAATARLGEKARLVLQGERAVLTLNGASPGELRGWLAEVRSGARGRPVEATLTRTDQGFSGTIVVAIGGAS